ncbi:MAG: hypothetical protein ABR577_12090 [Pyrinomonadaceae bacterium]
MTRAARFAFLSLLAVTMLLTASSQTAAQSSPTVLHYRDVVGTYETKEGDVVTVDRAARGQLRIHIEATYPYRTGNGEMSANFGSGEGTTKLVGDTALLKPENTERCTVKLVFKPQRLIVTQEGADYECGFGHNVNAAGTYKRKSRRVQRRDETGTPVKRKRRG